MAERRMFSKNVIESDPFMDMPAEAQMLYIHLNMASDDDGFCDNPRSIMRQCGASNDSMKLLIAKKFVLTFDKNDGFVAVIKHWRINNYIRKDNYRETKYKEFMRELYYDENRSYSTNPGDGHKPCIAPPVPVQSQSRIQAVDGSYTDRAQAVDEPLTQDRIGKDSKGKERDSIGEERKGKGECERGNPLDGTLAQSKPVEKVIDLSDPEKRRERIDFFVGRLQFFEEMGYGEGKCWYSMAEAEGIPRGEIDLRKLQLEKQKEAKKQ